jgi:CRP/FNR family transcriptional regulator, cyclic AMP receptor protein
MATTEQIVNFLQKVPLFQSLKRKQLEQIANRMVERRFSAGYAIVTQGKGGEGLFILVSGKAEAILTKADGSQVVVNNFGPTDFFGELAIFDEGGVRTASVVTLEPTQCLALIRWDFLGILREDAEMAIVILQELAKRFRVALETL